MIVHCVECGACISDTAERCPKCGRNRIVNLLPYQVTKQQEPTCIYQISDCPNHPVCIKCNYRGICNSYKAYCFAGQAVGSFIIAILVIVTICIILAY